MTLVLAIFMGGMALGAWIVSRRGVRWRKLILAYAVVEIVIGLAGLAFPPLFLGYVALSQDVVYPALDSIGTVRAWQWGTAALLITLLALLVLGPDVIFGFTAAITLGIFVGTYSSIYMATPILIWLGVTSDSFVPTEAATDKPERVAGERA